MEVGRISNRKFIYVISFLTIIISVLTISISYLLISSTISINRVSRPNSSGWKMEFTNIGEVILNGRAEEAQKPYIDNNSTSIRNFNISFAQYNDSAIYTFDVVNNGSIDAKVSSITYYVPKCYGRGEHALEDSKEVCRNIELNAVYDTGKRIKEGDVLKSGEKRKIKFEIRYTGEKSPANIVEIENLSMTVIYIQK